MILEELADEITQFLTQKQGGIGGELMQQDDQSLEYY